MSTHTPPNDGGRAFPEPMFFNLDRGRMSFCAEEGGDPGMSLREYYAGQAMIGLLSGQYSWGSQHNLSDLPREAFKIADAMIAARKSP